MFRLKWMDFGKARKRSNFFIDLRVIFHGAGAKRIKTIIDTMSLFCKLGVMAADFVFTQLWKMGSLCPAKRSVQIDVIAGWKDGASSARMAAFK